MTYDTIIIGAGPGGYELAAELAGEGKRVAIIERDALGGTCLNRGCIPTKCLCASASTILTVQRAGDFGVRVPSYSFDYGTAAERMRSVVNGLRSGIVQMLRDVDIIYGEARLVPTGVEVNGEHHNAERIIIATGSRPASLPIPGAELCIDSDSVLALETLPQSAVIIGGGVIGMEFASIMAAFGVQVTVLEFCKEILPPFDSEIAKRLRTMLGRRGVKTIVGAAAKRISRLEDGSLSVLYATRKGEEELKAETIVMAVGRRPVIPDGCEEAGIKLTEKGFICVDDRMQTSVPGIYAVGDVNGRCMLAHAATAQARVSVGKEADLSIIPSAVFTIPEVAMAGTTEDSLKASGQPYRVAKSMFAANGKAQAMGEGDGLVKVIYHPESRTILGVHIVGPHAADIVAEASALMFAGVKADDAATKLIHNHPTLSEALSAACAKAK